MKYFIQGKEYPAVFVTIPKSISRRGEKVVERRLLYTHVHRCN